MTEEEAQRLRTIIQEAENRLNAPGYEAYRARTAADAENRLNAPGYVAYKARTSSTYVGDMPTVGAPAKANAVQQRIFTGLCEALNTQEKQRAATMPGYVPDIYEVKFNPTSLGASTIKHKGDVKHSATPMGTNKQLVSPKAQTMDANSRNMSAHQGMPILQFIDMVMRNSSFINDQAKLQYDETSDTALAQSSPDKKDMFWFKISMIAEQLPQYDNIRNDYAYKITFLITKYRVFNLISPYFPTGNFKGEHKSYNYWFTGKNIEITGYEQTLNYQWLSLIGGKVQAVPLPPSGEDIIRRSWHPLSGQSNQGADGLTNLPSASAADSLYSPADYKDVKLTIVGDPAWIAQGEMSSEITPRDFDFNPFNKDGTINFDAGQTCFRIEWNKPSDYDLTTGIMNVSNTPKEDIVCVTKSVKSMFIKGKFTQELWGQGLIYVSGQATSKPPAKPPSPAPRVRGPAMSPEEERYWANRPTANLGGGQTDPAYYPPESGNGQTDTGPGPEAFWDDPETGSVLVSGDGTPVTSSDGTSVSEAPSGNQNHEA